MFYLDGYDEDGLFSVNWGWGGQDDGMFNIQTLNGYVQQQQFIPVTNKGVYPHYSSRFAINEGAVDFQWLMPPILKLLQLIALST